MNDACHVYTTSATRERFTSIYLAVSHEDRWMHRVEVHFRNRVHVTVNIDTVGNETMFHVDRCVGIAANRGYASGTTVKIVEVLAKFTDHPYCECLGIRLSKSNIDGYASRAIIRLRKDASIDDLCAELATVIGGKNAKSSVTRLDTNGAASRSESDDIRIFNLIGCGSH
jgi:hypothetical protein